LKNVADGIVGVVDFVAGRVDDFGELAEVVVEVLETLRALRMNRGNGRNRQNQGDCEGAKPD